MAAAQKPFAAAIFEQPVETPAWKTIPSWYLVATADKAIDQELQRFMAKRTSATTSEVKASHVAYISQPQAVVQLIEQAANAAVK